MKKNPFLIQVGNNIRQYRKQQGYTQEEFALIINLDRSYYGSVERGERNITILNLIKIADGLGIEIASLFNSDIEN